MKHSISLPTLAAALIFASSSVFSDTDWKTFAATDCQSNQPVVYAADGSICNESTQTTAFIHCPTVRDFSRSMFPVEARHTGRSGDSDLPLKCTMRNMNTIGFGEGDGSIFAYYATLKEIPAGEANSPGTNAMLNARHVITKIPFVKAVDYGATIMSCELPRSRNRQNHIQVRSCLYNYSVREFDGAGYP